VVTDRTLILSARRHGSAGPLVVLMPSLGRGAVDFDDLGARLGAAGYRAQAVNPRGVARTSALPVAESLHDYAADLSALIALSGSGPAHVIGHAFGNRVVRCLAADSPDLVRSVTLLACGGQVEPDEQARTALFRCFEPGLPDTEHMAAVRTAFFAPGNDPSVWRDGWWPAAARAESAAVRATDPATWRHAGRAPLLIVQGLQDRVAPPENGRLLKRELGGRVTLVKLDGAGHALLPEQPAAIAEAVLTFLAKPRSGHGKPA
jgi:pimeloyl-ACP methyl ester carboxylesterase